VTDVNEATWHNAADPCDVNGADGVTPLDVLLIINYINSHPGQAAPPLAPAEAHPFFDVNDDGDCTPFDVLMVINYINAHSVMSGEGEVVIHSAARSALQGLPSFEVSPEALLPMVRVVQPSTAWNDQHPRLATFQPLFPIPSTDSACPMTSPGIPKNVRDELLGRGRRSPPTRGVDKTLAGLDVVLSDIAEAVFHGWEENGGTV